MKSLLFRSLVILSLVGLTACSSTTKQASTPISKSSARQDRLLIADVEAVQIGYATQWVRDLNVIPGAEITSAVVLGDKLITIEAPTNLVTATSMKDGSVIWNRKIKDVVLFQPALWKNTLLVNSETRLYKLDANTGAIRDIVDLQTIATTGPLVVDEYAIFCDATGVVFALDLKANFVNWAYKLTEGISAQPVQTGFSIVAVDNKGVYAKISGRSGTVIWRNHTYGANNSTPGVDRLSIYIASMDQTLYCLDLLTGEDKWKLPFGVSLTASPKPIGLTVYQPVEGKGLYAIDSISGKVKWTLAERALPLCGDDDQILIASANKLKLIDVKSGLVNQEADTATLRMAIPVDNGSSVMLISPRGQIIKINKRS
ncbi:PQQ-binding-like beta-propeller repeat protein [Poriferisphaera sp. WC338]|uniref:outer membrane protein assembly factor BamB family protein n=1 Tax=Poriferisphaera sp. WC338 TaxID=3425129 RepID=UPI003D819880